MEDPTSDATTGDVANDAERARNARPAEQTRLPLGDPDRGVAADEPIPYALTARARRQIAPETLPDLIVVAPATSPATAPAPSPAHDPFDTRPARARALRRSGRPVAEIATTLGAEVDLVTVWCRDVVPSIGRRRRRHVRSGGEVAPRVAAEPALEVEARAELRTSARDELGGALLGADGAELLAATGAVVGAATISAHAVSVATGDVAVGALLARCLRVHAHVDPQRLRVVLQAGPAVARDVAVAEWAGALEVPGDRITHGPWPAAPHDDAVLATIRAADPDAAAVVAGWRDALLERLSVPGTSERE